ncbi:3-methyl-2-oxobutanoate hydroxymethyltransferase [Candidatus Nitrosocosmicus arcticus]|uniref:3-methyl-2-oxobutanoate hydroxymethyltransferase n=1 Tax=Candidatus Nitrosocosmicus arcticus TaxID=2035267 RepID=A0A557SZK5_9ARCH|nr:3-methyl-2-oxobutanoate hydroxymethyltransferase [Candidatus Nitrosocosmicus arcticus]TVP42026.1 3-methyl-2-oxobutanoate hydroxymethyltransferase [Candidatus Nitrosocosmicus arcticus]
MIPNISLLQQKKKKGEKITVVTAYDYTTSRICDESGVDILLVGDSAGMVMLGYPSTISVTMEEMMVFCRGVINGSNNTVIIADMPFGSYQFDQSLAFLNAIKFIKLGCHAVKIEGGVEIVPMIRKLTEYGIPVMGHIGLKPQTSLLWEGYKVQGKTADSAIALHEQAIEIEKAGAFSLVIELVTRQVAEHISRSLTIPTIGIGSGGGCDGQVLVFHDLVGSYNKFNPKFVKQYLESFQLLLGAMKNYISDVKNGKFPDEDHSFSISEEELLKFNKYLNTTENIPKLNPK